MINYTDTILAQYANSRTIQSLVESFNDSIDPRADIDAFYDYVFNVETAQGFGLDIWGKIVGVSRYLKISGTIAYFGFNEAFTIPTASTGAQPFDQAPFYNGDTVSQVYALSDDAYRTLILVKALANITDCSIKSLNTLMRTLFSAFGNVYVVDGQDMTMRFVFEFQPTDYQIAVMVNSGVVPRPSGVKDSLMIYDRANTFGFFEGAGQPFGSGTFFTSNNFVSA